MLGRTAQGLFWMFRYLERSENTARLIEAGFRIALTRAGASEWNSVLKTAGAAAGYAAQYETLTQAHAIDFLLRDGANPSSVLSCIAAARTNARAVRTALTREVWEAVNDTYLALKTRLARPVAAKDLPDVLALIRQQSALVRGAMHGSMMRDEGFDFSRIGTFLERADNTARILDVKYYVLLPSVTHVGGRLDNAQWDTILRSVAGERAYAWAGGTATATAHGVANFLIFDPRMPRSLRYSMTKIRSNLAFLEDGATPPSHHCAARLEGMLRKGSVAEVFDTGLHDFLTDFLDEIAALGTAIEADYRFTA
ncbi:MAG: alpha-E domain-containing protein [Pseudomonadota bacterium]